MFNYNYLSSNNKNESDEKELFTSYSNSKRNTNDTFKSNDHDNFNFNESFIDKNELSYNNRYIPKSINKKEFLFYSDSKNKYKKINNKNLSPQKCFLKCFENELKNQPLSNEANMNNKKNNKEKIVESNKIFNFNNLKENNENKLYDKINNKLLNTSYKSNFIDLTPVSILEAPCMEDDFYLNLLEWSKKNKIGVSLQNILYFFDFKNKAVETKLELNYDKLITSIKFDTEGNTIGIGTNYGNLIQLDIETGKKVRDIDLFNSRIVGLEYLNTMNSFLVGSKNCGYFLFDLRTGYPCQEFIGHKDEVIGIKANNSENYLASGNNNNNILLHSLKMKKPIFKGKHKAAVKALAWSKKNYNLLFSGGGSDDKIIKTWDTLHNFEIVDKVDTNSQVCNLFCLSNYNLLSSHGYKDNELMIWHNSNEKIQKINSLKAHNKRVCYMSVSPDESHIVTASGDETLKFWKLNLNNRKTNKKIIENNKYFR